MTGPTGAMPADLAPRLMYRYLCTYMRASATKEDVAELRKPRDYARHIRVLEEQLQRYCDDVMSKKEPNSSECFIHSLHYKRSSMIAQLHECLSKMRRGDASFKHYRVLREKGSQSIIQQCEKMTGLRLKEVQHTQLVKRLDNTPEKITYIHLKAVFY